MKQGSTIFLRVVIVLWGIGILAYLIRFPLTEGRNVDSTLGETYFKDPFLAFIYLGSLPFFVALYQAFRFLGYVAQNKVFSLRSARAVRTIKYCALALAGFVVSADAYIVVFGNEDDFAGPVVLGLVTTFVSIVIATAASIFESILQSAVDMKKERH